MGGKANITVGLNSSQAEKDAKGLSNSILGSLTPTIDVLQLASKAWSQFESFIRGSLGAAIEQETATRKLTTALRVMGREVPETTAALQRYNTSLQQLTGHGDESLMALEGQLTMFGVLPGHLRLATEATIGLAEATGQNLASAATDIAKIIHGQPVRALKAMGMDGLEASEVLQKLADKMDLAKDRTATLGGQLDLLSANWGDFAQAVGTAALGSTGRGGIAQFVEQVNHLVVGMTMLAEKKSTSEVIFERIGEAAEKLGGKMKVLTDRMREALGPLATTKLQSALRETLAEGVASGDIANLRGALPPEIAALIDTENVPLGLPPRKPKKPKKRAGGVSEDSLDAAMRKLRALPGGTSQDLVGLGVEGDGGFLAEGQARADRAFAVWDIEQKALEDIDRQKETMRDRMEKASARAEEKEAADRQANLQNTWGAWGNGLVMGIGSAMGQGIAASIAGGEDLGTALEKALGNVMVSLGTSMIATGLAAVALNLLSFIPFFAGVFGAPGMPLLGGLAAIAGGTALVAAGAAIGGASAGSAVSASPSAGAGAGRSAIPQGFSVGSSANTGGGPVTYVFNLQGSYFGGNRRQTQRDLQDAMNARAA